MNSKVLLVLVLSLSLIPELAISQREAEITDDERILRMMEIKRRMRSKYRVVGELKEVKDDKDRSVASKKKDSEGSKNSSSKSGGGDKSSDYNAPYKEIMANPDAAVQKVIESVNSSQGK